jgi:hypothetical protein
MDHVTDKPNTPLVSFLPESALNPYSPEPLQAHVTDGMNFPVGIRTERYNRKKPIRAIRSDIFNSDEAMAAVLAELEAQHHAKQAKSVEEWRARIQAAEYGDQKSAALIALFGGPEKVLVPAPWTFEFNRHKFPWRHLCHECWQEFRSGSIASKVCSDECASERNAANTRLWRHGQKKPPRPAATCGRCGETFAPARADARFCSGKCRVAAHRAKAA